MERGKPRKHRGARGGQGGPAGARGPERREGQVLGRGARGAGGDPDQGGPGGARGAEAEQCGQIAFRVFLALEGHPPRADARIQHFRAGVQGGSGGSLGGFLGRPVPGIWSGVWGLPIRWSIGVYLWLGGPARAGHGRGLALGGTAKP